MMFVVLKRYDEGNGAVTGVKTIQLKVNTQEKAIKKSEKLLKLYNPTTKEFSHLKYYAEIAELHHALLYYRAGVIKEYSQEEINKIKGQG